MVTAIEYTKSCTHLINCINGYENAYEKKINSEFRFELAKISLKIVDCKIFSRPKQNKRNFPKRFNFIRIDGPVLVYIMSLLPCQIKYLYRCFLLSYKM